MRFLHNPDTRCFTLSTDTYSERRKRRVKASSAPSVKLKWLFNRQLLLWSRVGGASTASFGRYKRWLKILLLGDSTNKMLNCRATRRCISRRRENLLWPELLPLRR